MLSKGQAEAVVTQGAEENFGIWKEKKGEQKNQKLQNMYLHCVIIILRRICSMHGEGEKGLQNLKWKS
jgi:hypothetical protein